MQEQELRPQQPDAFGAERHGLLRVGQAADVRGHLDAVAVERHRGFMCVRLVGLPLPRVASCCS